ncbi:hypothetical protein FIBSPDRAFT_886929 [Athelia psychrophila]|uniref:Uncharacterized protein n=1 Tax=Athelia psychrophila TaxID=1759441 RepID=A0A166QE33_9AGAM|nr:hypothetical protein FIBSPDRAFT_886929 [Fibularhizoctonia sp. CBS 109695]
MRETRVVAAPALARTHLPPPALPALPTSSARVRPPAVLDLAVLVPPCTRVRSVGCCCEVREHLEFAGWDAERGERRLRLLRRGRVLVWQSQEEGGRVGLQGRLRARRRPPRPLPRPAERAHTQKLVQQRPPKRAVECELLPRYELEPAMLGELGVARAVEVAAGAAAARALARGGAAGVQGGEVVEGEGGRARAGAAAAAGAGVAARGAVAEERVGAAAASPPLPPAPAPALPRVGGAPRAAPPGDGRALLVPCMDVQHAYARGPRRLLRALRFGTHQWQHFALRW